MKFSELLMAEASGDKKAYQAFFNKILAKYKVKCGFTVGNLDR
jgi:hypothetical protein